MTEPVRRPTRRAKELRNAATAAERHLWSILRARRLLGHKFSRQMPVGPFICDFLCREQGLVIELDGGQHSETVEADERRSSYLRSQGMEVVRFWNHEVMENLDGVYERIVSLIGTAHPPAPSRMREEGKSDRPSPSPLCGSSPPALAGGVGR